MTPTYLLELAAFADPDELWKLRGLDQLNLTAKKQRQLDTGVALRRLAHTTYELTSLIGTGKSLCITQLSAIASAKCVVDTPAKHLALIEERAAAYLRLTSES